MKKSQKWKNKLKRKLFPKTIRMNATKVIDKDYVPKEQE